jgi:F-type H+-transporting ATPase subunit b
MQINLMPDVSLFAVLVIFVLNYFVVSRFLIRPVNGVLEAREQDARTAQETYEQALARFNEATAQIEEQMHLARKEASQLRDRFRTEAATHRHGLIERTAAEAKRMIDETAAQLKKDIAAARDRIVREAESLARLAAERILGRAL